MSSTELWRNLHDIDNRIDTATTTLDRDMWIMFRRIVRMMLQLHFPEECPEEWPE